MKQLLRGISLKRNCTDRIDKFDCLRQFIETLQDLDSLSDSDYEDHPFWTAPISSYLSIVHIDFGKLQKQQKFNIEFINNIGSPKSDSINSPVSSQPFRSMYITNNRNPRTQIRIMCLQLPWKYYV